MNQNSFEHMVVAYNFGENSILAVRRALRFANSNGRITIIHGAGGQAVVAASAAEVVQELRDQGIDPESGRFNLVTKPGNAGDLIPREIQKANADLAIIGQCRRKDRFGRADIDIAISISHRTNVPILLVGNNPPEDYKRVMVAVDDSKVAKEQIGLALRQFGAAVDSILHVFDYYPSRANEPRHSYRNLEQSRIAWLKSNFTTAKSKIPNCVSKPQLIIESGFAPEVIRETAAVRNSDLIVIGTSNGGFIRRASLGSVAHSILLNPPSDIMLIPPSFALG